MKLRDEAVLFAQNCISARSDLLIEAERMCASATDFDYRPITIGQGDTWVGHWG